MSLDIIELIGTAIGGAFIGGGAIVALTKTFWQSRMTDREDMDTKIDERLGQMQASIDTKHKENQDEAEGLKTEVHIITEKLDNRYVLTRVFDTHISEMGRRLGNLEAKNDQILAGVLDLLRDKQGKSNSRPF